MRASTNETKQSLQRQEKFGRDNRIPEANWFREYASGGKNDRVELNRLLSIVNQNDEIYTVDPSRLTRSLKYLLELVEFAKSKRLKFVMGDFTLDCTGEGQLSVFTQGQLMMLGLINEIQRLMIVEAVCEGLAASKERGVIGGRPRVTKDSIPDAFYRYYAMYQNGDINKSEFSRLSGLSRKSIYKYLNIVLKR